MKRREITNRKLVSALTIAISAMMAIQTPITAYASDADLEEPGDGGSGHESTVETGDSYEPVTNDAQEAADAAQEAVSDSGNAQEAVEQGAVEQETGEQEAVDQAVEAGQQANDETPAAMETAEAAADIILNGDASQNVEAAAVTDVAESQQETVSDLIEAAENVVMDTTTSDGQDITAATTDLQNASQSISDAKDNLVEAEKENKTAESSFDTVKEEQREMLDCAEAINQTANEMLEDTELASQKSAMLVDSIQTAGSIDEAKEAYRDLEQLVDEAKQDLALRKALYDRLTAEYEAALKNLETAQAALDEAEERFEAKTSAAATAASDAQASVDAAKDKVDNLAGALSVVQDKLEDEKQANNMAARMGENNDDAWKNNVKGLEPSRETMRNVVINYYMTQVLGIDVVDYKFGQPQKGVDGQEYNYTELTYSYIDKDGNKVEGATKYFNWDSLVRQNYDKTGINDKQPGIVVFEKDAIEVAANQYVISYYNNKDNNVDKSIISNSKRNSSYKDGYFDVYSYVDDKGDQHLIIRDELIKAGEDAVSNGDAQKPEFSTYKGYTLTKIVQNHNSLLHDANCLIVASDKNIDKYTSKESNTDVYKWHIKDKLEDKIGEVVANSKALNAFIINNKTDNNAAQLITKYAQYKEETDKAQAAADKAQEKVNDLSKAIDEVVSRSQKSRKTMKATTALGVEDIAAYLGLKDIDEAEALRLNDLTVAGLISELNSLKGKASENAGKANENLENLKKQFADAEQDLSKAIDRLTPKATGENSTGIENTGSETDASVSSEGATSSENASSDGTGAVRPAAGLAAQAVAAIEEAVNETTHAQAVEAAGTPSEVRYDANVTQGSANTAVNVSAIADAGADAGANAGSDAGAGADAGAAAGAGVDAGAGTGVLENSITINDGDTALSDAPDCEGQALEDEIPEDTEFATGKTTVAIAEEDTALSMAAESNTVPEKKNFWWILLIAIFGVAGEKMYKEHMEKKKEKEQADTK